MTGIEGCYYDGRHSAAYPARLYIDQAQLRIQVDGADICSFPLRQVVISSRLGNTPRCFSLPDGGRFETLRNQEVDLLLKQQGAGNVGALIHLLESKLRYVAAALILTMFFGWLFFQYGLPKGAELVAMQMPVVSYAGIAEKVLEQLDEQLLQPTRLPADVRERLEQRFQLMIADDPTGYHYQLLFRSGGRHLGANALALPSGLIIMTDELVDLAENDEELVAVLAHEIGHVVHRHGIRQVLQNSVIMLAITYATGDVASVVLAFPTMLLQMGYSREFEFEADAFALNYLQQNDIAPHHFADILLRIETSRNNDPDEGSKAERTLYRYLSTHPETSERIRSFLHQE